MNFYVKHFYLLICSFIHIPCVRKKMIPLKVFVLASENTALN